MTFAWKWAAFGAALAALTGSSASAEDLFAGKTITIVVGYGPGGGFDAYARLAADHLGKFIPGHPTVVVENMEGGGGRKSEVYLAGAAPKDGTTLSVVPNAIAIESVQHLIPGDVDAAAFGFIGRLMSGSDAEITWDASATKTFADAQGRETIVGSAGPTSQGSIVPRITNAILGTRFKIVEGYKGTSDLALAMVRGEIEGMNFSLQNLPALHPDWIADKKVHVLWLQALERDPAFPDVPTLSELAKDDGQRGLLTFVASDAPIGRSLAVPPGVPASTIAVLRTAFDAMVADADFVADAAKRKLPLRPATGQQVQDWIKATMATSPETIERLKAISTGG